MKRNAILRISLVGVLTVYFFFSLLEIYNVSALYKDQVEMPAMVPPKNISSNFCWELIDDARTLTNWINFFEYSALTSLAAIAWLIFKSNRNK